MKTNITKTFFALAVAAVLTSCSKKSGEPVPENPGNFILAVTPIASTGVADYLVTASDLDKGTVSIIGNGVEQDGTYRYYVTANNKFFSMLYGQGSPGAVTSYNIKDGKLNKLSNFVTETVQAFTPVNDDILLVKVPRNIVVGGNTLANFYRVNTNSLSITAEGTLDAKAPGNNGEIAHFSWIRQVGNKVYAPFFSIKNNKFETDFPNTAWVAIYSYPAMQLEKVITDDRTSFIGRYFTDGLGVVENGDIYAFSTSVAINATVLTSTKPSAITKIKAGTTEFDKTYFCNFEEISEGEVITNWIYVGGNNFVVNTQPKASRGAYITGKTLAIVNVVNKTFKKVTGFPEAATIKNITAMNYSAQDGKAYMGVNLDNGTTYVYKVDAVTAVATQGLKVEGGLITSIKHLQ
jgi:hypothetical protein